MLLDIVILPPGKLRQKIGQKIKKAVSGIPHGFVVDNRKLIPHLSLFHIKIGKARLPELFFTAANIVRHYQPIKIHSTGTHLSATGSGICYYMANKPAVLVKLHKEIIRKCQGLRTGMVPWKLARPPSGHTKNYRREYGSQHVLKNFRPHFTTALLRQPERDSQKVLRRMRINFAFTAREIYICEVNNWLQVIRIIKTFKLKNR